MSAPDALLAVDRLTVRRGARAVVEDVSFAVLPGDLVAVVGPNGAGKSSLFAALLGLVPGVTGRAVVAGRFAYVPQGGPGHAAFPVTALDVAVMGAYGRTPLLRRVRPADRDLARRALARVGLLDRAGSPFTELSGGQRQRVLLARALVQQGSVLLLDEPLSGVDAASARAIVAALDEERAEGRAVVIATHDLAWARRVPTAVLLLNRTVHAFGPPSAALTADSLARAYGSRLIVFGDGAHGLDEGSHGCGDDHHDGRHDHGRHDHHHEHGEAVPAAGPVAHLRP
jgi:ABC-type Mn2+/Zn2+ transport system ATPase subunit